MPILHVVSSWEKLYSCKPARVGLVKPSSDFCVHLVDSVICFLMKDHKPEAQTETHDIPDS